MRISQFVCHAQADQSYCEELKYDERQDSRGYDTDPQDKIERPSINTEITLRKRSKYGLIGSFEVTPDTSFEEFLNLPLSHKLLTLFTNSNDQLTTITPSN